MREPVIRKVTYALTELEEGKFKITMTTVEGDNDEVRNVRDTPEVILEQINPALEQQSKILETMEKEIAAKREEVSSLKECASTLKVAIQKDKD